MKRRATRAEDFNTEGTEFTEDSQIRESWISRATILSVFSVSSVPSVLSLFPEPFFAQRLAPSPAHNN
jgi:hypothetical protein